MATPTSIPTPSSRQPQAHSTTPTHTNIASPATASALTSAPVSVPTSMQSIPMGRGYSQRSQRSTPMRPVGSQRGSYIFGGGAGGSSGQTPGPPILPQISSSASTPLAAHGHLHHNHHLHHQPHHSLHVTGSTTTPASASASAAAAAGAAAAAAAGGGSDGGGVMGSTPLVASLSTEGLMTMNINSPSALLALGLSSGMTPPPPPTGAGAAAAGSLHALHEGDLPTMPTVAVTGVSDVTVSMTGTGTGRGAGEVAEERSRRLNEVMSLLRSRVGGRGISRKGVVQLSKLEQLECMWQGDNLTVAGSSIDLEIEFEIGAGAGSDFVKDIKLSYALATTGEVVTRSAGAEVLKRNIMLSEDERRACEWKKLDMFHGNIQRLARMDQLSKQISCFSAIGGLHKSLSDIWQAEEMKGQYKGYYDHISLNSIGEPKMDQGTRIGLVLDYWVSQRRIFDRRRELERDEMDIDVGKKKRRRNTEEDKPRPKIWSAEIDCEEGYPSLRISSEWVSPNVFSTTTTDQEMTGMELDGQQRQQETKQPGDIAAIAIDWLEPPPTMITPEQSPQQQQQQQQQQQAETSTAPIPADRRFVARLDPPISLPIRVASDIFRTLDVPIPADLRSSIYDHLVVPSAVKDADAGLRSIAREKGGGVMAETTVIMGDERKVPRGEPFRKTVYAYEGGVKEGEGEGEGRMVKKRHDYVFHVFEPTMGCTIRNLPFGHPRQLSEVLPVLRQYALLSNLLERAFSPSTADEKKKETERGLYSLASSSSSPSSTYISNITATRRRLNTAVGVNSETYYNSIDPRRRCALEGKRSANTTLGGDDDDDDDDGDDVDGEVAMIKRVDISLRTLISGPPSIMLLFQVDTEAETVAEEERIRQMITIDVSIGLNGQIDVTDVSGPWQEEKKDVEVVYEDDDGEEEGKECKEEDAITKELRGKLKKVLEICEDLSVAIEWMEEWVKRWRRGRRRDGRWG